MPTHNTRGDGPQAWSYPGEILTNIRGMVLNTKSHGKMNVSRGPVAGPDPSEG